MEAEQAISGTRVALVVLSSAIALFTASGLAVTAIGRAGIFFILLTPFAVVFSFPFWPSAIAAAVVWVELMLSFVRRIERGGGAFWKVWVFSVGSAAIIGAIFAALPGLLWRDDVKSIAGFATLGAIGGLAASLALTRIIYEES